MRAAPIRTVFYAVNGTGVGHLVRLLSIARWMRRYAALLGAPLEAWFLTTSEADAIVFAEGFAAFKLPSKTIVAEAGLDRRAYLALAKQWVWHTLGLLRPDLLVVDTFPRGSFGELLSALDLCKKAAFVYRPVRPEVAERPDFQSMLGLYDAIVVPEHDAEVLVPEAVRDRVTHVGPILSRERCELLGRDEARARVGAPSEAHCVYVSAGGGGDKDVEAQLLRIVSALSTDPTLYVVLGTGPLYRGRPIPGTTHLPGSAAEHMAAFDAAVCAAGYNTFGELMFAGVPTVFCPQEKLADDQAARANRAVAAGAASLAQRDEDMLESVRGLLAGGARAAEAARALIPENHARAAAAELLRLVAAPRRMDALEHALDDEGLRAALAIGELDALDLAGRLGRGHDTETACVRTALAAASALLRGLPRGTRERHELGGLVDAVVRAAPLRSVADRAEVVASLMSALGPLVGGEGAAARAIVAEGAELDALTVRARAPA